MAGWLAACMVGQQRGEVAPSCSVRNVATSVTLSDRIKPGESLVA